jgi:hypothetical protein
MKFARLLRTTAKDLPELDCLFQDYKDLKKVLNTLPSKEEGVLDQPACVEAKFVETLSERIQKLNDR